MQPLILAEQTRQGIADFLSSTFPATTAGFSDLLTRFLAEPETLAPVDWRADGPDGGEENPLATLVPSQEFHPQINRFHQRSHRHHQVGRFDPGIRARERDFRSPGHQFIGTAGGSDGDPILRDHAEHLRLRYATPDPVTRVWEVVPAALGEEQD